MERGSFVGSFCKWEILSSEGWKADTGCPTSHRGRHWERKRKGGESLEMQNKKGGAGRQKGQRQAAKGYSGVGWVTKRLAGLWTKF